MIEFRNLKDGRVELIIDTDHLPLIFLHEKDPVMMENRVTEEGFKRLPISQALFQRVLESLPAQKASHQCLCQSQKSVFQQ